jgi:hypothetical protein
MRRFPSSTGVGNPQQDFRTVHQGQLKLFLLIVLFLPDSYLCLACLDQRSYMLTTGFDDDGKGLQVLLRH